MKLTLVTTQITRAAAMPPKKKAKEGKQQVNVAQSVSSKGGKAAPKGLSSEAEAVIHSSSCPSSSNATRVSVESIASSPITALANEYWSVPHDVRIPPHSLHCTSVLTMCSDRAATAPTFKKIW